MFTMSHLQSQIRLHQCGMALVNCRTSLQEACAKKMEVHRFAFWGLTVNDISSMDERYWSHLVLCAFLNVFDGLIYSTFRVLQTCIYIINYIYYMFFHMQLYLCFQFLQINSGTVVFLPSHGWSSLAMVPTFGMSCGFWIWHVSRSNP